MFLNINFKANYNEDEIHVAVNQIIDEMEGEQWEKDGKPSYGYIVNRSFFGDGMAMRAANLFLKDVIKEYFSREDEASFKEQTENYANFSYDQSKITKKKLLLVKDIIEFKQTNFWKEYEKKYGRTGFYTISFPLFSADGTKMLVNVERTIFYASGGGSVYVFKKESNKWKIWKVLTTYIS